MVISIVQTNEEQQSICRFTS